MKKLLALLLLSPLVDSQEKVFDYCKYRYDPAVLSKEFGQCVGDLTGFTDIKKSQVRNIRQERLDAEIKAKESCASIDDADAFDECYNKIYFGSTNDKTLSNGLTLLTFGEEKTDRQKNVERITARLIEEKKQKEEREERRKKILNDLKEAKKEAIKKRKEADDIKRLIENEVQNQINQRCQGDYCNQ